MKNNENKLIVEFMEIDYVDVDTWLENNSELKYQESWDWLIPVVKKCLQTGNNTDEWDEISNSLNTMDKEVVYNQIIEFIKQYNIDKDGTR